MTSAQVDAARRLLDDGTVLSIPATVAGLAALVWAFMSE
jgi:hypothetical protein